MFRVSEGAPHVESDVAMTLDDTSRFEMFGPHGVRGLAGQAIADVLWPPTTPIARLSRETVSRKAA